MENQKNPEDNEFEIQIPTKTEADSVKIPEKSFTNPAGLPGDW